MPPWPSRLHLGPSTAGHSTSRTKGIVSKDTTHTDNRLEGHLHDQPLLGVPVLDSSDSIVPSPPKQKPRHGRSHSNPFSSIFGNGKKPEKVVDAEVQDDIIDKTSRLHFVLSGSPSKDHLTGVNSGSRKDEETDFMTGRCSTCDSPMKWPKHVKSYRCQICLMINDLKPFIVPLGDSYRLESTDGNATRRCRSTP